MGTEATFDRGGRMKLVSLPGAAWLSALVLALPAAAAQQAGICAAVNGEVGLSRPPAAQGRPMVSGEPILLEDTVRSGQASGAQLLLLDKTVFTIGPESEVLVDEFVYDPATNAGRMTARVAHGVFRLVSGAAAKTRGDDVTVALPSGTLGIRGTLVAGRVDRTTKAALLVLLGEGRENDVGELPAAIEVCNAGRCVEVTSAGFGTRITGPGDPPVEPYRIPAAEVESLTRAVSDPKGWGARLTEAAAGNPDVASMAEGDDSRTATEISGRPGQAADGALPWRSGAGDLDDASVLAAQDAQKAPESAQDSLSSGSRPEGFGYLPPIPTSLQLTTYQDLVALVAAGSQTAVYSRSGIPLTDGGSYDFSLTLDFGGRTVSAQASGVRSPSLDLAGQSLATLQPFDPGAPGSAVFVRESGRIAGGEGPCAGGCDAFLQAFIFSANGRIADALMQGLAIVPPAPDSGPAPAPVVTADPYDPIPR